MIAALAFMEKPDGWSDNMYFWTQMGGIFMVVALIWDGALGFSTPIIGLKLFGRSFDIKAKCTDCGHEWKRGFSW